MPTYATEPRVQFERRDSGLLLVDEGPTTDRVLVIGVAVDGPNDKAVVINSMDQLTKLYGPTNKRSELGDQPADKGFNGNWLVRTAREAFAGGCREIAVRRVGGEYAYTTLSGYNYVPDDSVTIYTGGAAQNLTYGGFPTPNDGIANTPLTVAAINGSVVRLAGTPASLTDYVDWFVYFKGRYVDARILSVSGMTVTLAEDLSAYISAADEAQICPKGNFRVFDSNGAEFNPFNFVVTAGSTTVESTIQVVTTPVTLDPRYSRSQPTTATVGESVIVQYLMKPDQVIVLQSKTPSDIYNARGAYGTADQDGCWITNTQSLPTLATVNLFVPKFRSSPLTTGNVQAPAVTFRLSDVGTLDEMVAKINLSGKNTSVAAYLAVDATWNGVPVTINGGTAGYRGLTNTYSGRVGLIDQVLTTDSLARFVGGASGLEITGDAYYNLLTGGTDPDNGGILEEVEEFPADVRVIAGVNADDTVNSTAGQWTTTLAKHCWNSSRGGRSCVGIIGARPQSASQRSASDIRTRVATLTTAGTGLADLLASTISELDDYAGTQVDVGAYITVLGGPDGVVKDADLGTVVSNLAGIYAGLVTSLPVNRSTIQAPVSGVRGLLYEYSRKQRNDLTKGVGYADMNRGGAYTTFRSAPDTGTLIVHSGETAAGRTSQYSKLGVVRIVQTAEKLVASQARKYIGQPNITPVHQAMENACKQQLEALADVNALSGKEGVGYKLRVFATGNDTKIGKVNVEMWLKTAVEIRWIYIPVTVEF